MNVIMILIVIDVVGSVTGGLGNKRTSGVEVSKIILKLLWSRQF